MAQHPDPLEAAAGRSGGVHLSTRSAIEAGMPR
jgi:hypothetical protein